MIFKKHKWGKYIDVAVITSSGYWKLLQVSECELTGKKKYRRARMGWINDFSVRQDIINKTNIK